MRDVNKNPNGTGVNRRDIQSPIKRNSRRGLVHGKLEDDEMVMDGFLFLQVKYAMKDNV